MINAMIKIMEGKIKNSIISVFVLFLGVFIFVSSAVAANFYVTPNTGVVTVGETFSVDIKIYAADTAINAAEGEIAFSKNNIEVKRIVETESIFSSWVQPPSFSNTTGKITFGGLILRREDAVSDFAKVLTIEFEAKNAGNADVFFVSGSVIAGDGFGSNILQSFDNAVYTIVPGAFIPQAQVMQISPTPNQDSQVTPEPLVESEAFPSDETEKNVTQKSNTDNFALLGLNIAAPKEPLNLIFSFLGEFWWVLIVFFVSFSLGRFGIKKTIKFIPLFSKLFSKFEKNEKEHPDNEQASGY